MTTAPLPPAAEVSIPQSPSPVTRRRRRPLSWRKRCLFSLAAIAVGIMATELISACLLFGIENTYNLDIRDILAHMQRAGEPPGAEVEAVHPYLGWVLNPQANLPTTLFDRTIPVNELGFNDFEHDLPKRSPDKVVIAVCGGSVAWQFSVAGEATLRAILEKSPAFQGRKLEIVRLALSGYKQPQQLMSLNYMLALGAEFDVVLNIDGYNEVALAATENDSRGVFMAYPHMWYARLNEVADPRRNALWFNLLQSRALRQQIAIDRLESWLPWSPTLNLIWLARDRVLAARILELEFGLRSVRNRDGQGFAVTGPKQLYHDSAGMQAHVVDLWSNCSTLMQQTCRGAGIRYIHVLQPNQYLPDSKPMTPLEREKTIFENQEYGLAVKTFYPRLIERVAKLRKAGVNSHDLTGLFRTVEARVYQDPFCHLNPEGNRLLAEALAPLIEKTFEESPN